MYTMDHPDFSVSNFVEKSIGLAEKFEASLTNSVDPDQTAPIGAV